ncbi:MAG: 2-hydroxychromene-2-carboxylate isomerase [Pseudomonadales bacterium]|jgi:2-hydroxychromene-2-carboxylate isomerase|nr:2-hydroxychromene-2-carboxylate isomerase [Pseudomonadales bacterium]
MAPRIEFFFDYASPYSWLADQRLPEIAARHGATLVYRPALLGALVVESGNTPPPAVPAKAAYYRDDLVRWTERLGLAYRPNPHFPVASIALMRGALVAQREGVFPTYHEALWRAMWTQAAPLHEEAVFRATLTEAGLDAELILRGTQDATVKAALRKNVEEALGRGAFGLPTLFLGDAMYFGNDRVDFVEEALAARSR